ncbi:MAG: ATP-binding protein [Candidatus Sedimenticola sp. (ex Thyasira tokunagai)]
MKTNDFVAFKRDNPRSYHPIFDEDMFRLITPEIEQLQRKVTELIYLNATGAAIIGFSRAGKTIALESLCGNIYSRTGNLVPVKRYSVHRRDQKSIKQLFQNIFKKFNLYYKPRESLEEFIDTLTIHLAELAHTYQSRNVLFVVDEAQRLKVDQIDVFSELYDELKRVHSIVLTVVFVGNKGQLGTLLREVVDSCNEHIEGRFFRRIIEFHGIRNAQEVRTCLSQYDKLKYPEHTGPTYTEHFLREDFENGFRLADCTEGMWDTFHEHQKKLKINEWGMEYFTQAVKVLLVDYLPKYGISEFSNEMVKLCIDASTLESDLRKKTLMEEILDD